MRVRVNFEKSTYANISLSASSKGFRARLSPLLNRFRKKILFQYRLVRKGKTKVLNYKSNL